MAFTTLVQLSDPVPSVCRSRATRLAGRALLVLLVMGCVSAASAADFRHDYREGVLALERGQLAEAANYLKAAIRQQPEPSADTKIKLFGVRFQPYLPYYNLGVVAYELCDCTEALSLWETAETKGAVQQTEHHAKLKSMRQQCIDFGGKPPLPACADGTGSQFAGLGAVDPVVADVVRMLGEGVADGVVFEWLKRRDALPAELAADDLIALTRAGASQEITLYLLEHTTEGPAPANAE